MKPYGIATDARSTFANKLKRINHEFFHQPRMALSMMAQTVLENKDRVCELKNTVAYIENFYKKLEKIEDDLKVLNDTDRENVDDPDGAVERVIRFLNKPGQFLPLLSNAMNYCVVMSIIASISTWF